MKAVGKKRKVILNVENEKAQDGMKVDDGGSMIWLSDYCMRMMVRTGAELRNKKSGLK